MTARRYYVKFVTHPEATRRRNIDADASEIGFRWSKRTLLSHLVVSGSVVVMIHGSCISVCLSKGTQGRLRALCVCVHNRFSLIIARYFFFFHAVLFMLFSMVLASLEPIVVLGTSQFPAGPTTCGEACCCFVLFDIVLSSPAVHRSSAGPYTMSYTVCLAGYERTKKDLLFIKFGWKLISEAIKHLLSGVRRPSAHIYRLALRAVPMKVLLLTYLITGVYGDG